MTERETAAHRWLLRPSRLGLEIERKKMQAEELRSCAEAIGGADYKADRVQSSPVSFDRIGDLLARVADLDAEIKELQRLRAEALVEIVDAIDKLEDERERWILTAFYIKRMSMSTIAEAVHYSLQWAYHLQRRGLQRIGEVMKCTSI